MDSYDILLFLITKAKRVWPKNKYTLRNWILVSNLVDFIVSKALMNRLIIRTIFHSSELLPLDHAYPEIIVDGQDFDRLD